MENQIQNICKKIINNVLQGCRISFEDSVFLYKNAKTTDLMYLADTIRQNLHPENEVSWIVDRNVNITNVCASACSFCNFYCSKNSSRAYVTNFAEYKQKIIELFQLEGNQLLLQGGINTDLDLKFYTNLFSSLKTEFPNLRLHALSPTEIHFLAKKENKSYRQILENLIASGLDSLPGAGAEILNDRVRNIISPNKITSDQWIEVMRVAHSIGMLTSATMMFAHIETLEERIEHLFKIRKLQDEKQNKVFGFMSFIPWIFCGKNTTLEKRNLVKTHVGSVGYIRLIAISRIVLDNIPNIQASWLTVGQQTAALCLHAGANDLGSIMIEENVVSAAGAKYKSAAEDLKKLIIESGFIPRKRNQDFTDYRE